LDQHRDGNGCHEENERVLFLLHKGCQQLMERVVILASPNTLLKHIKSSAQNKEAMISVVLLEPST